LELRGMMMMVVETKIGRLLLLVVVVMVGRV